jgi:hypothetical protein
MLNKNHFLLLTLVALFSTINSEQLIYTKTAKTLVVLDDWHYIETHSNFWSQLRGNNTNYS